jgi:hypothetical protein
MKRNPVIAGIAGIAGLVAAAALLLWMRPSPPRSSGTGALSREDSAGPQALPAKAASAPVAATAGNAAPLLPGQTAAETPYPAAPMAAPAIPASRAAAVRTAPGTAPDFSDPAPAAVLENLRGAFRQYQSRFGGNPVGTNPEITRALTGGNPKQAVFVQPEDGLRVNDRGELIDSWGTPFFLHQLSGTVMEIHSAGPDRVMWTADDFVTK